MDLVIDVLILVKWECPTQADIHDDTHRPHVQRAVVALIQQNFRRQISRGPDNRAAERLLANDAGKSEVA